MSDLPDTGLPGETAGAHIEDADGHGVRLRAPHDLSFLTRWGRVVEVFDDQDSGSLCFHVVGPDGEVFVKYAGAPTMRFAGAIPDAVAALRASADAYRALAHPALIPLRDAVAVGAGFALVFDWFDGVSLGRHYGRRGRLDHLTTGQRASVVQQLYDFAVTVAERGWVPVDLYDSSLLVHPATARLGVCDIDIFRRAPTRNDMGGMWGSSRFMAPEEFEWGAPLDEVTNVFTLGGLAHTLLGDDQTKDRASWRGSDAQWQVAHRALLPDRADRWPTVAALASAWRAASGRPDADR